MLISTRAGWLASEDDELAPAPCTVNIRPIQIASIQALRSLLMYVEGECGVGNFTPCGCMCICLLSQRAPSLRITVFVVPKDSLSPGGLVENIQVQPRERGGWQGYAVLTMENAIGLTVSTERLAREREKKI